MEDERSKKFQNKIYNNYWQSTGLKYKLQSEITPRKGRQRAAGAF